jgi:hypothetical protein
MSSNPQPPPLTCENVVILTDPMSLRIILNALVEVCYRNATPITLIKASRRPRVGGGWSAGRLGPIREARGMTGDTQLILLAIEMATPGSEESA